MPAALRPTGVEAWLGRQVVSFDGATPGPARRLAGLLAGLTGLSAVCVAVPGVTPPVEPLVAVVGRAPEDVPPDAPAFPVHPGRHLGVFGIDQDAPHVSVAALLEVGVVQPPKVLGVPVLRRLLAGVGSATQADRPLGPGLPPVNVLPQPEHRRQVVACGAGVAGAAVVVGVPVVAAACPVVVFTIPVPGTRDGVALVWVLSKDFWKS